MWTIENRARYDRSRLRYPSDLTDAEWALMELHIPPAKLGGNKRTVNLREIANGLMYILSTGCQWRAIPKDLPPRSTLHDYFDLWSWDGTLDSIHHALYVECRERAERKASPTAAIIDSQSVKSAEKGALYRPAWLRCRQEDQGQEAAYSRRHARPLDARHRACRRYPGSRRRRAFDGHAVRPLSFSPQSLRRWRISGCRLPRRTADYSQARERRDRQALRSSPALRRPAQTLARRANLRLARAMPKAGQGLGMSQPQGARLPQARFHSPQLRKLCNPR